MKSCLLCHVVPEVIEAHPDAESVIANDLLMAEICCKVLQAPAAHCWPSVHCAIDQGRKGSTLVLLPEVLVLLVLHINPCDVVHAAAVDSPQVQASEGMDLSCKQHGSNRNCD